MKIYDAIIFIRIFSYTNIIHLFYQHINQWKFVLDVEKWSAKNTFSIPDYLSGVYQILKEKFVTDFSSTSVPTIELMLEKLTAWINLLENESNYSSKFVHELRYPKISTMDWSVIRLPNDNYTNVMLYVFIYTSIGKCCYNISHNT